MKKSFLFSLLIFIAFHSVNSQNKNAEIINYETKINISSDNIITKDVSVTIQINNRAGEDLTIIEIPYDAKEPISNLNAQLEDILGNTIRRLKKKEIVDQSYISNSALYEDDYIKAFTLKHNEYPYRISYNYKKTYKTFFSIARWSPVMYKNTSTKVAELELTIPYKYKIIIDENNIDKAITDITENKIKYTWSSSYKNDYKYNILSPDRTNSIPLVRIAPANFKFGEAGNQENWINFGNWVYRLNEGLNLLPEKEKRRLDELLKDKNTESEKIDALYKYMQENTRYINVAIGIGGFKPYSATYVSENKYGDCKALTNYMKSILSYAGIQSNYTLIYSGDKVKKINKDFTSSQFNHAVLLVPGKEDTTWLECTSKYNPTGYWGTSTQNRYALVIDKDNSKLIKTPKLEINDVEELRSINFSFIENSKVSGEIKFLFKGGEYEYFNSFNKTLNQNQKDKYIHNLIPFNNYNLEKWEINKDNHKASLSFDAKISLKNYIKSYDSIKYVGLFPTEIPSFEKPHKRIQDVQIDYPINIKDSLVYHNINGYNVKLVKDTTHHSTYGTYNIRSKIIPEGLLITKQFILYSNKIELKNYKVFYEFIKTVKTIERKSPIIYTKK